MTAASATHGYEVVEVEPDPRWPNRRWAVAVDGVVPSHGRYASASAAGRHRAALIRAERTYTEGATATCRLCRSSITYREVAISGTTGEPVLRWCVAREDQAEGLTAFGCKAGGHHLPDFYGRVTP